LQVLCRIKLRCTLSSSLPLLSSPLLSSPLSATPYLTSFGNTLPLLYRQYPASPLLIYRQHPAAPLLSATPCHPASSLNSATAKLSSLGNNLPLISSPLGKIPTLFSSPQHPTSPLLSGPATPYLSSPFSAPSRLACHLASLLLFLLSSLLLSSPFSRQHPTLPSSLPLSPHLSVTNCLPSPLSVRPTSPLLPYLAKVSSSPHLISRLHSTPLLCSTLLCSTLLYYPLLSLGDTLPLLSSRQHRSP